MRHAFHAVIHREEDMWVGQIEEVPGAISQGYTLTEIKENLKEALSLVLQTQRDLIRKELVRKKARRESIVLNYN